MHGTDITPDCALCGGVCDQPRPFMNRNGEAFCSPYHRSKSNRMMRDFRRANEPGADAMSKAQAAIARMKARAAE